MVFTQVRVGEQVFNQGITQIDTLKSSNKNIWVIFEWDTESYEIIFSIVKIFSLHVIFTSKVMEDNIYLGRWPWGVKLNNITFAWDDDFVHVIWGGIICMSQSSKLNHEVCSNLSYPEVGWKVHKWSHKLFFFWSLSKII